MEDAIMSNSIPLFSSMLTVGICCRGIMNLSLFGKLTC